MSALDLTTQALAYLTAFYGMWLCGKKHLLGPVMGIVSTVFWVAMAVQARLWSMIGFEGVYLFLETRMAILWFRAAKQVG